MTLELQRLGGQEVNCCHEVSETRKKDFEGREDRDQNRGKPGGIALGKARSPASHRLFLSQYHFIPIGFFPVSSTE